MRLFTLLSLLFITATSFSQEDAKFSHHSSVMGLGERMIFGDKAVKFKKVISDSRCPVGVTCVREGEATILVEVYENEELLGEQQITAGSGEVSLAGFFGAGLFSLSALELKPYPKISSKTKASEYFLHISVKEENEI